MTPLTPRQQEVADLVARGYVPKDIAAELGIGLRRVTQIITRIAQLWGLDPRRSYRQQIAQRTGRAA